MTKSGREWALDTLGGISGLAVYDSKALAQARLPYVIVRKVGDEEFDYLDSVANEVVSVLRVEIVAKTVRERDRLATEVHEGLKAGGRVLGRNMYYEGVDPDMAMLESPDVAYRVTFQYRIMET